MVYKVYTVGRVRKLGYGSDQKSAAMAAEEASAVGLNWTFLLVDVARDAEGRVMEGAGEDAFLKNAVARVQGFREQI
jgi:beta-glucosidase